MIIWAILMAVVIFMVEASHGAHHDALWVGFGATALFGVYLGLRRRVAAASSPLRQLDGRLGTLWIAAMVRDGFFKGLAVGFSGDDRLVIIGGLEFATLFIVGSFIRLLRGSSDLATGRHCLRSGRRRALVHRPHAVRIEPGDAIRRTGERWSRR